MTHIPGTIFEDMRVYNTRPYRAVVYASIAEDIDTANIEEGFIIQTGTFPCPICDIPPTIRLLHTTLNGHRNLCLWCVTCNLLYRSVVAGNIRDGEYYPLNEELNSD